MARIHEAEQYVKRADGPPGGAPRDPGADNGAVERHNGLQIHTMREFADGRTVIGLGDPEAAAPETLVLLKPSERLIDTSWTTSTVDWFRARTDSPDFEPPVSIGESVVAIADLTDTMRFKIIDIDTPKVIPDPERMRPWDRIEGNKAAPTRDGVTPNKDADTDTVLRQKHEAKARINGHVRTAISEGNAVKVLEMEGATVYVLPVSTEMEEASVVEGDPTSKSKLFQAGGSLLEGTQFLTAQVKHRKDGETESEVDDILYITPAWGKATTTADNPLAWKKEDKTPQATKRESELKDRHESEKAKVPTIGTYIDKVTKTRTGRGNVASHLVTRLMREARQIHPNRRMASTEPAINNASEETRAFNFQKEWQRRTEGLPEEMVTYLEGTWMPAMIADNHKVRSLLVIEDDATEGKKQKATVAEPREVKYKQELDVRDLSSMPEHVIDTILTHPKREWPRLVAEYFVVTQDLQKHVADVSRKVGYAALGQEGAEALLHRHFLAFKEHTRGMSWDQVAGEIEKIKDESLRQAMVTSYVNIGGQGLADDETKKRELAKSAAAQTHERALQRAGLRHFKADAVDTRVDLDYNRVYMRAESLVEPAPGLSYEEIATRQTAAIEQYGQGQEVVYETEQSRAMTERLIAAGYSADARIPWMSAEGVVEVPHRERLENFAAAIGLATSMARDLYVNPEKFAKQYGYKPGTSEYDRVIRVGRQIQIVADWKFPNYIPRPTADQPGLMMPLVTSRPDFARVRTEDGGIGWKATELENSYGGPGMQEIIMAGYPEAQSDLTDKLAEFMAEVGLPKKMDADFNRKRLTIVMTEDWAPYRGELEIFLEALRQKHGIETQIHSIEELADREPEEKSPVESGFVFHFAYPWNFIKDPAQYHLNIMLEPQRVSEIMGYDLKDVLRDEFVQNGEVNMELLQKRLKAIKDDSDYVFSRDLDLPIGFWQSRLRRDIYRDTVTVTRNEGTTEAPREVTTQEDILTAPSRTEKYAGQTLQQAGATIATRMTTAARELYARQGHDLYIYNDPANSRLVHTKTGLAAYHLPEFQAVFQDALGRAGFADAAETFGHALTQMTARTVALTENTGEPELDAYVQSVVEDAIAHPQKYVLKLAVDPQYGAFDWGSRGVFMGPEMSHAEWRATVYKAVASKSPYLLQEVVENVAFDQPRTDKKAHPINAEGTEQIALFNRNPEDPNYDWGDLYVTGKSKVRFNPFLFSRFGQEKGKVESRASAGIMTIRPEEEEGKVTKVHGASDAAMAPVVYV